VPRRLTQPLAQHGIGGEQLQRAGQRADIARRHEQPLATVIGEIGKVAGAPADDRKPERHRFAPHRPVRLAEGREDENVCRGVQRCDLLTRERAVNDDASGQVVAGHSPPHTGRVGGFAVLIAGEVERCRVRRQAGDGVEQLENSLARDPVGHAQERRAPPCSQPDGHGRHVGDVAARWDDPNALAVDASDGELVGEQLAGDDKQPCGAVAQAIEWRLEAGSDGAVVDPAGGLVQHADQRSGVRARRDPRAGEGGGDAVEEDRGGAEPLGAGEYARRRERRQWEWAVGERKEHDPGPVVPGGRCHPQVVEITARRLARVAEGHKAQHKMRVVHVAPTPFGHAGVFGGGERYPVELARALARRVDCELITFGVPADVREPGGLRVRVLRPVTRLGHPAHAIAVGLPAALAGADVVHTHHTRSAPSRVAALVARARGAVAVTTDHGLPGGTWGGALLALFHRFLMVSEYSARELGSPPSRTRVVYGGVDCDRYHPDRHVGRQGILFVGRLTPHKGVDRLIRALPGDTELVIAGTAGHDPQLPERDYPDLLRSLARGRPVRFVGAVPDDELVRLYQRAAVLALPSVDHTCFGRRIAIVELLGLAALEAMASGTPVVGSRVGGLPEVVEDRVTGLLVEPGDVDGLHAALDEVVRDPVLAGRLGRNARDRALERFTWDACAARCLAAYEEIDASGQSTGAR
jgi:glycosyltransferase involved in cell wall biosynthesis